MDSLASTSDPSLVESGKAELVRRILRALSGIDYGSVEIVIQDSKVVQIERNQKSRFPRPLEIPPPSPQ